MESQSNDIEIPERLRRFAQEWKETFDHVEDSVFLMDCSANVVWGNKRFLQKTPLDGGGCSHKKCYDWRQHQGCDSQGCPVRQSLQDGKAHTMEVVGDRGEPVLVMIFPVFDINREVVVGAIHLSKDISSHKDLQEFVGLLELVGDSVHGVNNGLAVINSNLDNLKEYVEVIVCREKLVEQIREAVRCKAWEDVELFARQLDLFERKVSYAAILSDLMALIDQTRAGAGRIHRATRGMRFFMPRGNDQATSI
ncbi:MAG: hypothetical protein V2A70_09515 [Candidatus Omnitrophota bacterium]